VPPNSDHDLRLRLALFEHIDRLRRESGGVVTSRQLNQRFTFEGVHVPVWNQQQGIFRPAALRDSGVAPAHSHSTHPAMEARRNPGYLE
jgi:hypothetical protein